MRDYACGKKPTRVRTSTKRESLYSETDNSDTHQISLRLKLPMSKYSWGEMVKTAFFPLEHCHWLNGETEWRMSKEKLLRTSNNGVFDDCFFSAGTENGQWTRVFFSPQPGHDYMRRGHHLCMCYIRDESVYMEES